MAGEAEWWGEGFVCFRDILATAASVSFTLKYLFFLLCFQMKTVSVALVLCLNVGVDPPDVVKTTPCARLECWIGKHGSLLTACLQGHCVRRSLCSGSGLGRPCLPLPWASGGLSLVCVNLRLLFLFGVT